MAKVVVNDLSDSAWGMFTIVVTIPAALLTGLWMYKIRPGRVGEASLIGVTLVMLGVVFGQAVRRFGAGAATWSSASPIVDHPAGLRGGGLDPAGVGVALPARLSQLRT